MSDPRQRFENATGTIPERLYEQMALIRRFEVRLLELFEEGVLFGTTHCCIGQEADCAGVISHLGADDVIFSNHRCHGHFLSYTDDPRSLMAELMGRLGGVCGGRGGSQHICYDNMYTNGIQGGIVPNAVGMALAEKMKGSGAIATVFIGDGTLGQGVVYEAMNMASLWSLPILIVCENNEWAQSTPTRLELAGKITARAAAMGLNTSEITSTDGVEMYEHFAPIVESVRRESRPHFALINTYRLCHHSKSDDKRPRDEVEARRVDDPIPKLRARLDESTAARIEEIAAERVEDAIKWSREQPFPELGRHLDALDLVDARGVGGDSGQVQS